MFRHTNSVNYNNTYNNVVSTIGNSYGDTSPSMSFKRQNVKERLENLNNYNEISQETNITIKSLSTKGSCYQIKNILSKFIYSSNFVRDEYEKIVKFFQNSKSKILFLIEDQPYNNQEVKKKQVNILIRV